MKNPKEWLYPSEISRNADWILTGSRNTYDCNFHLVDRNNNIDHLIDAYDIEESGIDPYKAMDNDEIDILIELTWTTKTYEF